jgi:hypothetical protein
LDRIIATKELVDSEELRFFIKICESWRQKYVLSNGRLELQYGLDELRKWNWASYSAWVVEISLGLIHFLSDPKNDYRKLKRCQQCNGYYIAKTLRSNQKYCSDACKRGNRWPEEKWAEYMRDYRARKRREMQAVIELNKDKEIRRRMEVLGLSREEVLEQMEADEVIDRD